MSEPTSPKTPRPARWNLTLHRQPGPVVTATMNPSWRAITEPTSPISSVIPTPANPVPNYGPFGVATLSYTQQKLLAYLQSQGPASSQAMRETSLLRTWDLGNPDQLAWVERELEKLQERGLVVQTGPSGHSWDLARHVRDVMNVATQYEKFGFEAVGHE